jgi:hypothetical protein
MFYITFLYHIKRCSNCKKLLPATTDYFYRDRSNADGLSTACADCRRKEMAQRRRDNPEKQAAYQRASIINRKKREDGEVNEPAIPEGFKQCNTCKEILPATTEYFHRDKSKADGLHTRCASCRCNAGKKWREEHPEESAAYHRKLYYENHEKRKAVQREYDNAHRAERTAYERAFYAEHPELKKAKVHRRKARKHALPNTFTGDDWQRCLEYWGNRCAACGREPGAGFVLSPDHWIPLSAKRPDNPGTVPTNIVPLCTAVNGGRGGCNNGKHTTDPYKWLVRRFGEQQATEIVQRVEAYFAALRTLDHQEADNTSGLSHHTGYVLKGGSFVGARHASPDTSN